MAASVSLTWLLISLTKEQKSSDERGCRAGSPHSASRFWAQSRPRLSTRRKGGMREAVQKANLSSPQRPLRRTNHACNVSHLPDRKHMAGMLACCVRAVEVCCVGSSWGMAIETRGCQTVSTSLRQPQRTARRLLLLRRGRRRRLAAGPGLPLWESCADDRSLSVCLPARLPTLTRQRGRESLN